MEGQRAGCVFIDPPYNDPIDGYVTGFGKLHHSEFAMASGEMSKTEFTEFLHKAISQLVSNSTVGALHFIFMDW
jgi:16S rRNA G966 N2-methylase RsmD